MKKMTSPDFCQEKSICCKIEIPYGLRNSLLKQFILFLKRKIPVENEKCVNKKSFR